VNRAGPPRRFWADGELAPVPIVDMGIDAERVEARLTGPHDRLARARGERHGPAVDGEPAAGGGGGAALPGPGVHPQPLDVGLGLGRRDLGEVLDVVDAQLPGGGDETVVAVDGEVAEGVRARGGGRNQHERAPGREHGRAGGEQTT